MQSYNPRDYKVYIITSLAWEKFLEKNNEISERIGQYILPDDLEEELQQFFNTNLGTYFKISFYNGGFQKSSKIFNLSNYREFIFTIKDFWLGTIRNNELISRENFIIFTPILPFTITGSFFHYFDKNYSTEYEVRANYGILHNVNSEFDTYFVGAKKNLITKSFIVKQKKMHLFKDQKILQSPVSLEWQNKSKLEQKMIMEIVEIGRRVEKIFKLPIEMYWGAIDNKLYILNINPQFDGVIDNSTEILNLYPKTVTYRQEVQRTVKKPNVQTTNDSVLVSRLRSGL